MIRQIEREAAVPFAERFETAPDDLTCGGQRIEIARVVAFDPGRQDLGLEDRRRQRRALKRLDRVEQRVEAGAAADDTLPGGDQSSENGRLDRLDLPAKLRQRAASNRLQNVRVTPLPAGSPRPELSFEESSRRGELLEDRLRRRAPEIVAGRELRGRERPARAGITPRQILCGACGEGSSSDSGSPCGSGMPSASR